VIWKPAARCIWRALADGMPKVSNVEHYARIVKEKAILRNPIPHHAQYPAAGV
jgi:replicative DNA helicase